MKELGIADNILSFEMFASILSLVFMVAISVLIVMGAIFLCISMFEKIQCKIRYIEWKFRRNRK